MSNQQPECKTKELVRLLLQQNTELLSQLKKFDTERNSQTISKELEEVWTERELERKKKEF